MKDPVNSGHKKKNPVNLKWGDCSDPVNIL